jgi:hypothetical protein
MHRSLWEFTQSKLQNIEVKGSYRPTDWASASYSLFNGSLVQVLSADVKKMRWCTIILEPREFSLMKNHTRIDSIVKSVNKKRWYTAPTSVLCKTTGPNILCKMPTQKIDRQSMLISWCHGDGYIVIHPDMGIMKIPNTAPSESLFNNVDYNECKRNIPKGFICSLFIFYYC